jgi:hypothetical protein
MSEAIGGLVKIKSESPHWKLENLTTIKLMKLRFYWINNKEKTPTIKTIKIVKKEKQSELLTDLLLSPNCQVRDTLDAYEEAKYSDKTKFWFISKWEDKFVIVLDFSKWKKPKISRYSLNKYKKN